MEFGSLRAPPARVQLRKLDHTVPFLLRPLVRAFLLGYLSAVGPRIVALITRYLSRTQRSREDNTHRDSSSALPFLHSLGITLRKGFGLRRFPAFCAGVAGGSTLLEPPIRQLCDSLRPTASLSRSAKTRLARLLSSFIAAWLSIKLLQSKISFAATTRQQVNEKPSYHSRTIDLTALTVFQAADVIVGSLWKRRKIARLGAGKWSTTDVLISKLTDPTVFAISSAIITWNWIYHPSRLPAGYAKWITSAAAIDPRLVEALRRVRHGEMHYGLSGAPGSSGQASLLEPMCVQYKLPLSWADPAQSVPIPCELYHMGWGPSCEMHALWRFSQAFNWALATYLPLTLALQLRSSWHLRGLDRAVVSAVRSSAFLGSFIALFYYGVCLVRTRIGPHVIGTDIAACNMIDGGLCTAVGCALCGWSAMIEPAGRRKELALFVGPRALATLVPRSFALDKQWRETTAFAISAAVVLTSSREDSRTVRGLFGTLLGLVLAA